MTIEDLAEKAEDISQFGQGKYLALTHVMEIMGESDELYVYDTVINILIAQREIPNHGGFSALVYGRIIGYLDALAVLKEGK